MQTCNKKLFGVSGVNCVSDLRSPYGQVCVCTAVVVSELHTAQDILLYLGIGKGEKRMSAASAYLPGVACDFTSCA